MGSELKIDLPLQTKDNYSWKWHYYTGAMGEELENGKFVFFFCIHGEKNIVKIVSLF